MFLLKSIDEITLSNHYYLNSNDICFYFCEYSVGQKFSTPCNSLILNFKKKPSEKEKKPSTWKYKEKAIEEISDMILASTEDFIENCILIPMPPSKSKKDSEYDNRMEIVLDKVKNKGANQNKNICVVNLLELEESRESMHTSQNRMKPQEHCSTFNIINSEKVPTDKDTFIIFDDILASGSTFKGAQMRIQQQYPNSKIMGLFIARAINVPPPFVE